MPYIASTLSADTKYVDYRVSLNGPATATRSVLIKGGAHVPDKHAVTAAGILVPEGLVTLVTDEELEFLKSDEVFQTHLKNGYVKIMDFEVPVPKAVVDMNQFDPGAPLDEQDLEPGGRAGFKSEMVDGQDLEVKTGKAKK